MATLTLSYDARSLLMNKLIEAILTAGAKIVEPQAKVVSEKDKVLAAYQKMFGKRNNNKYTDNEIFVFNSQRSLAQILERYED